MPGLAANEAIFENLKLSKKSYTLHYLQWIIPHKNEAINKYCIRLANQIKHENIILVGVSFGGIIVQELSSIISPKLIIIISSISSDKDLPNRIKFFKHTKLLNFVPKRFYTDIDRLIKITLGENSKKRQELYRKYLSFNDPVYLDWAFKTILTWKKKHTDITLLHIHGTKDSVFPIKHIKSEHLIKIDSGSHIMIMKRYKWFNENLPKLINDYSE